MTPWVPAPPHQGLQYLREPCPGPPDQLARGGASGNPSTASPADILCQASSGGTAPKRSAESRCHVVRQAGPNGTQEPTSCESGQRRAPSDSYVSSEEAIRVLPRPAEAATVEAEEHLQADITDFAAGKFQVRKSPFPRGLPLRTVATGVRRSGVANQFGTACTQIFRRGEHGDGRTVTAHGNVLFADDLL